MTQPTPSTLGNSAPIFLWETTLSPSYCVVSAGATPPLDAGVGPDLSLTSLNVPLLLPRNWTGDEHEPQLVFDQSY